MGYKAACFVSCSFAVEMMADEPGIGIDKWLSGLLINEMNRGVRENRSYGNSIASCLLLST